MSGFSDTTYSAVTGLAYDATNKKLGLKVGADTVIPFSGGSMNFMAFTGTNGTSRRSYVNADGTYSMDNTAYNNSNYLLRLCDSDLVSSARFTNTSVPQDGVTITLAKTGYYILYAGGYGYMQLPEYHTAGSEIASSNYASTNVLMYLGETNPFA